MWPERVNQIYLIHHQTIQNLTGCRVGVHLLIELNSVITFVSMICEEVIGLLVGLILSRFNVVYYGILVKSI